jgi:hypothetical protein
MHVLATPPFPLAGAGVIAIEALLAATMISLFWVAYPRGFAELGAMLAAVLLGCWFLAYSLGAKVLATTSSKLKGRARGALLVGAVFGVGGIVLGFLGGPHLAAVAVWGVIAQFLALVVGRLALAT